MLSLDATPEGTGSFHGFMALQMKGEGKSKIASYCYKALLAFSRLGDLEDGKFFLAFFWLS